MKKRIILLLIPLLFTACGRSVESSDPQVKIETRVGEEFKVILESNPTTGYHWEVVGELDGTIVDFDSREYRADKPITTGSGGSDVFIFKAVGMGETRITLGYYPPSNNPVDPEKVKTFTVIVK